MTTQNNGGTAFPVQSIYVEDQETNSRGMTLRDYFAANVLPSVYADYYESARKVSWFDEKWKINIALEAYAMADAMLEARK